MQWFDTPLGALNSKKSDLEAKGYTIMELSESYVAEPHPEGTGPRLWIEIRYAEARDQYAAVTHRGLSF